MKSARWLWIPTLLFAVVPYKGASAGEADSGKARAEMESIRLKLAADMESSDPERIGPNAELMGLLSLAQDPSDRNEREIFNDE